MNLYKEYGIYQIRNTITNQVYIGKTSANFGDRRDCHFASLRTGVGVNKNLQDAWNKYGEDAFVFEVLYSCSNGEGKSDLDALERKFIRECRESHGVYNVGIGGDTGSLVGTHMSEETKRKIGEKNRIHMTGRKLSAETRKKMSESQKARYASWTDEDRKAYGEMTSKYASGYHWSDASKKAFSELQKTKPNSAKYDVETVREIRRLHEVDGMSIPDIAKKMNMNRGTVYGIATYKRWKNA